MKADRVKEELSGLRVAFTLAFVALGSVAGAIFTRNDLTPPIRDGGLFVIVLLAACCIWIAARHYSLLGRL